MTREYSQPTIEALPKDALVRLKDLIELRLIPFSRATLWRLIKAGRFPQPVKVTNQISAWRCSDVRKWAENPEGYLADAQGGRS